MALTAYCKKCGKEVDPGERCPLCGSKLGKTAAHAVWCLERVPVRDWISWNAVMRVLLPAGLAVVIMVLLLEGISGGPDAVEQVLRSGFLTTLAVLLGAAVLLVFVILLLRGPELADYVIDSRGVHETRYLPGPTPLKLLVRGKSPALARNTEEAVLRLSVREISWN